MWIDAVCGLLIVAHVYLEVDRHVSGRAERTSAVGTRHVLHIGRFFRWIQELMCRDRQIHAEVLKNKYLMCQKRRCLVGTGGTEALNGPVLKSQRLSRCNLLEYSPSLNRPKPFVRFIPPLQGRPRWSCLRTIDNGKPYKLPHS